MDSRFALLSMTVAAALALSACAEKKQLTEMHDSTEEMRDTTKEMRDTTNKMNRTTGQLANDTSQVLQETQKVRKTTENVNQLTNEVRQQTVELYDAARQDSAARARRESFESAYKAENGATKLSFATKYFYAYEFQLWTGVGQDADLKKREHLMNGAVQEFFKEIREVVVDSEVKPFAEADKALPVNADANKNATLNAFAATMHMVNRKQEENIAEQLEKHDDLKVATMYSIIVDSLNAERDLAAGKIQSKNIPEFQHDVMGNKKLALHLLQVRHNFLATIFISEAVGRDSWREKLNAGLNYYLSWGRAWTLDLDQKNEDEIKKLSKYLKGSLKTRQVLVDLGVQPKVDKTVMAFLKGVQTKTTATGAGSLVAAKAELNGLIAQFRAVEKVSRPSFNPRPKADVQPAPQLPVPDVVPPTKPQTTEATLEEQLGSNQAVAPADAQAEEKPKKKSLWQKLKDLFGKKAEPKK